MPADADRSCKLNGKEIGDQPVPAHVQPKYNGESIPGGLSMNRRRFLLGSAGAATGTWLGLEALGSHVFLPAFAAPAPLAQKVTASDTVVLGKTGIRTSRLAMGTGTVGSGHHSNQTALGLKGLSDLLLNGYDHGLRFFDSADAYGSHPHVAEALKHVPRDKVTVLTKTWARD